MSDFTVDIERGTTRRKIILSVLIEKKVPGLIGIKEEDFKSVSDEEIEEFIASMTPEEKGWATRRYAEVFRRNTHASQLRLHPPKGITVGRAATGIVEFDYNEVSSNVAPIDPSRK
jgi:hypothetical protein